jgi:hypothetical protein
MAGLNEKLLAIYLQDHLAGSTAGLELFRRAAGAHKGSPLGDDLEALTLEVTSDQQALVDLMAMLGVDADRLKTAVAWVGEKVGRLKLNGALLQRSPLTDVVELEAMCLAVQGKAAGWRLLQALADADPRLAQVDFADLLRRADDQSTRLESLRIQVAQDRLTT